MAPLALVLAAVNLEETRSEGRRRSPVEVLKGAGALSEQEVGKMLFNALEVGSILFLSRSRNSHNPFS